MFVLNSTVVFIDTIGEAKAGQQGTVIQEDDINYHVKMVFGNIVFVPKNNARSYMF